MKKFKTRKRYKYPHIRYNPQEVELNYQKGIKIFNSMSIGDRIKNGFGENGHPHPRRFYIFLQKYFKEVRCFMSEEERVNHVFPWVVATRAERLRAISLNKVYFQIKQTTLRLAKLRLQNYLCDRKINKNN